MIKRENKIRLIVLLILGILLNASNLFAQHDKIKNLPKYDKQTIHFGFDLGINVANFKVHKAGDFNSFDSLYIIDNIKQTGFNIGIVSNLRVGEHFDLRFIPSMIFAQRNLDYTFYINGKKSSVTTKQIESTFLELPLTLKFKSNRIGNARCYALVGGQYMIDMVSQAKVMNKDKQYVKLSRNDYGYHVGMGFDFYMEMFKLSMEMKMYNGINNLLVPDDTVFAKSLNSLHTKMFYVSFYFE